ncbi:hypothetical protein SAMN05216339_103152 [Nitrosomonas eutropha]|uniref:Transglutaminase-like domain-containing protein n=1 Tax=Nitrosomonas eutropha TaxID=916 RepID=A0A1I7GSX8_9PROT|nr:hypothetical protein [Nitrosomonas eutropha]SFU51519.1 hypothetical protein SAMN05216339_103152 [Nitrosomonas eutropha]
MLYKAKITAVLFAFFSSIVGTYIFFDWHSDNKKLLDFARTIVHGNSVTGYDIEQLNDLIYHTGSFAKNNDYFLLPSLGPTPIQILQKGGDCSDKSRLLAAILDEMKISATLVMLAPCDGCPFGHTVVEAQAADGAIAVDPVYNISFPSSNGHYYGIKDLRDNSNILPARLDELILKRGSRDKVAFYRGGADGIHYSYPVTINWEKNFLTRSIGKFLMQYTDDASLVYRPRWLEDPKLLMSGVLGVISIFSFLVFLVTILLPHPKVITNR